MTYPGCLTDFYGTIQQGGDQFWSLYARKLDQGMSNIAEQPFPLANNYYLTFGAYADIVDLRNATKFYAEDVLTIPHKEILG